MRAIEQLLSGAAPRNLAGAGIDGSVDMWFVLSDLPNVMTAGLGPNRRKSRLRR
jgi:hypothetical protein